MRKVYFKTKIELVDFSQDITNKIFKRKKKISNCCIASKFSYPKYYGFAKYYTISNSYTNRIEYLVRVGA